MLQQSEETTRLLGEISLPMKEAAPTTTTKDTLRDPLERLPWDPYFLVSYIAPLAYLIYIPYTIIDEGMEFADIPLFLILAFISTSITILVLIAAYYHNIQALSPTESRELWLSNIIHNLSTRKLYQNKKGERIEKERLAIYLADPSYRQTVSNYHVPFHCGFAFTAFMVMIYLCHLVTRTVLRRYGDEREAIIGTNVVAILIIPAYIYVVGNLGWTLRMTRLGKEIRRSCR